MATPTPTDFLSLLDLRERGWIALTNAQNSGLPTDTFEAMSVMDAYDQAAEMFRSKYFPKAGRVVAIGTDVFVVSPTGRSIRRVFRATSEGIIK